ncbi:MAG: carboxypeptidase-like regulatory domain-containing protein [Pirellula sp.]
MTNAPLKTLPIVVVCALFTFAGCSDNNGLAPVSGRVLLDDKPVEGAAVMFQPEGGGVPATGVTGPNGEFTLTTSGVGDGASLGMNGVSVVKSVSTQPNRKIEESEIVPMKFETPVKYASPKTSGISIDVKHGMQPVELTLKSGK